MTNSTVSASGPIIPWGNLFKETIDFLKKSNFTLLGFLFSFFLLSLMGQFDDFDWHNLNPVQLWLSLSLTISIIAVSYFVIVSFMIWVRSHIDRGEPLSVPQVMKHSTELLVSLTILSLRGALISIVGFVFFVVPGLYYSFKYELASACLILEGWQDDTSPIQRAEQLISRFGFQLLILAIIMVVTWLVPMLLEQSVKMTGAQMTWGIRIAVAMIDAVITLETNLYFTLVVLFMMRNQTVQLQE